jgi:hypothetical protein
MVSGRESNCTPLARRPRTLKLTTTSYHWAHCLPVQWHAHAFHVTRGDPGPIPQSDCPPIYILDAYHFGRGVVEDSKATVTASGVSVFYQFQKSWTAVAVPDR